MSRHLKEIGRTCRDEISSWLCWLTTFFFNINAISWVATIGNMSPLGRCRETRYPSNETGLVLLPGPILFIFYFPISFRRYMSWRGQFGFLVVASGMGRWFSSKIKWTWMDGRVQTRSARSFSSFSWNREPRANSAFPIVRVNKASSFFFFSFHRLILIFGRERGRPALLPIGCCCCCCCL